MRAQLVRHACRRPCCRSRSGFAVHRYQYPPAPAAPCVAPMASTSRPATCLPLRPHPTSLPAVSVTAVGPLPSSRRSFFSYFKQPPPSVKAPEYPPGWRAVLSFKARRLDSLRPPPKPELVLAFGQMFVHKLDYGIPVNSTQAHECFKLFRYLLDPKIREEPGPNLTIVELVAARDALLMVPNDRDVEGHLKFSEELYAEIQRQRKVDDDFSAAGEPESDTGAAGLEGTVADDDYGCYIQALASFGASQAAVASLNEHWAELERTNRIYNGARSLWIMALRGLAKEGLGDELSVQAGVAEGHGVPYGPEFREIMTTFFAQRDMVEETQSWFSKESGPEEVLPTAATYSELIRFSIRTKSQDWLEDIFRRLIEGNPSKAHWDVIFEWAILCQDEGVEGVQHMADVMTKNNADDASFRVDIDTINHLLRLAMEKNDHYLAERFMNWGERLGLQPNATTYVLQLDYRAAAKDLSGAREVYSRLRLAEPQHDEDLPALNKYLRGLCASERPAYKAIQQCVNDLEQRVVTLDPETVVTLCMTFFSNDDQFGVIDTLATHVFHYSKSQRDLVRQAFEAYILEPRHTTARVWDAYQLLKQFFDDAPKDVRLGLAGEFFRRNRADMAVRVFVHMKRQQVNDPALRPTSKDYCFLLSKLATCPDDKALHALYNQLKIDTGIQPSTALYNALMLAFSGSDDRRRMAFTFWNEISKSKEGPSYRSFEIVFYVCEKMNGWGVPKAREIWDNMYRMELEIPIDVFNAYCGTVATAGDIKDVRSLLVNMPAIVGYEPNLMTLGIAHNAFPFVHMQDQFKRWAEAEYPTLWKQLESLGTRTAKAEMHIMNVYMMDTRREYKIQRILKPED